MAFDGVSVESLAEMTFENKAAVFLIAFEMKQNENEDKTSNANVSSNNSLESDDIHNEMLPQSEEESVAQKQLTARVGVKSLKALAARILEGNRHVISPFTSHNEALSTPTCTENEQIAVLRRNDAMSDNEDLYLPRSALVSTSTGLAAKEHLESIYEACSEDGQCNEAAAYMVHVQNSDKSPNIESASVNQTEANMETSVYPTNQLFYDETGLAYTYDGFQFYTAQSQPYYTEDSEQTDKQPQCMFSQQSGETTYVDYVPQNYMIQPQELCDTAQGYTFSVQGYADTAMTAAGYSQAVQFPPPQCYTEPMYFDPNGSTLPYEDAIPGSVPVTDEALPTDDLQSQSAANEEWSTNDDSENPNELACVYESESGRVITIEPLDDQEHSSNSYNEIVGGFRPPKVTDGVPVMADGLMKIENKNFEDIPADCPFPSLFVSENGLITVLLRNGICLEMTPKRDLRLVNHSKKLVAATNDRGSSSILIHPALKLVQNGTTTELDLFLARKAKMKTESITFGNHFRSYKFDYKKIVEETCPMFRDLTEDESVDFLFSPNIKRKDDLVAECIEKSIEAHFDYFSNGGFKVFINGVKVVQTSRGDVYVTNGPKNLQMSATSSRLEIQTHFIEASVEANWNVKVKRGTHTLNASHMGFVVSNGHIEAAFDDRNRLQVVRLPDRVPLRLGQYRQRRPGVQRRRYPYRGPWSEDGIEMASMRYR